MEGGATGCLCPSDVDVAANVSRMPALFDLSLGSSREFNTSIPSHIYNSVLAGPRILGILLRSDLLQLLRAVYKLIGIRLGNDPPLVGLLHEELISLLVGKADGVLLGFEVEVGAHPTSSQSRVFAPGRDMVPPSSSLL